jgi:hypothetical protein
MRIAGKNEISGNIMSIVMNRDGIGLGRIFYGEYVEGGLIGEAGKLLSSVWDFGGVRRRWGNGASEFASIYGDLAIYVLRGYNGTLKGMFKVRGFGGAKGIL